MRQNCQGLEGVSSPSTLPWSYFLTSLGMLVDYVGEGDPPRAGDELTIFGVSWAVLHELQHLIYQQARTAPAWNDLEACKREDWNPDVPLFAEQLRLATQRTSAPRSDAGDMSARIILYVAKGRGGCLSFVQY